MNCLLCHTSNAILSGEVFKCSHCGLTFKNPSMHLNYEEESKRYSYHQNGIHDQGYVDFLNRMLLPLTRFLPKEFSSLDYGCGPAPTVSRMLQERGGNVHDYDPLFCPDKKWLNEKYDVVTSTEVVEHFKNPKSSWEELTSLIRPSGVLAIMTQFLREDVDYQSWWYKNDPTHVVFYNDKTFAYLAERFELEIIFNDRKSVIIFRKK